MFVGFDGFRISCGVIKCVAELVPGVKRGRSKLNCMLKSANSFGILALLNHAKANLDPGFNAGRILFKRVPEIVQSAVIVTQPQRAKAAFVPPFRKSDFLCFEFWMCVVFVET